MPLYNFLCQCGQQKRVIASKPPSPGCPSCGSAMEREASVPGVTVVEVLDNGAMRRPLERMAEAPRLHKEHVKAVESDKG